MCVVKESRLKPNQHSSDLVTIVCFDSDPTYIGGGGGESK